MILIFRKKAYNYFLRYWEYREDTVCERCQKCEHLRNGMLCNNTKSCFYRGDVTLGDAPCDKYEEDLSIGHTCDECGFFRPYNVPGVRRGYCNAPPIFDRQTFDNMDADSDACTLFQRADIEEGEEYRIQGGESYHGSDGLLHLTKWTLHKREDGRLDWRPKERE